MVFAVFAIAIVVNIIITVCIVVAVLSSLSLELIQSSHQSLVVRVHPVVIRAHPAVKRAHPGVIQTHPVVIRAHSAVTPTHLVVTRTHPVVGFLRLFQFLVKRLLHRFHGACVLLHRYLILLLQFLPESGLLCNQRSDHNVRSIRIPIRRISRS